MRQTVNQALARFSCCGQIWPISEGLLPLECTLGPAAPGVYKHLWIWVVHSTGLQSGGRGAPPPSPSSPHTSVHVHNLARSMGKQQIVIGVHMVIGINILVNLELHYDFQVSTWVICT